MTIMSDLHPMAAEGFSRGADSYGHGRPEFPPAALDWLRDDLGLHAGSAAVDLGAGTGKFTRLLMKTGARVVAIEPVAAMRNRLAANLPEVTALRGQAQHMPLPDASADTTRDYALQAFALLHEPGRVAACPGTAGAGQSTESLLALLAQRHGPYTLVIAREGFALMRARLQVRFRSANAFNARAQLQCWEEQIIEE
jgi:SAM-dependent methyltransferase